MKIEDKTDWVRQIQFEIKISKERIRNESNKIKIKEAHIKAIILSKESKKK